MPQTLTNQGSQDWNVTTRVAQILGFSPPETEFASPTERLEHQLDVNSRKWDLHRHAQAHAYEIRETGKTSLQLTVENVQEKLADNILCVMLEPRPYETDDRRVSFSPVDTYVHTCRAAVKEIFGGMGFVVAPSRDLVLRVLLFDVESHVSLAYNLEIDLAELPGVPSVLPPTRRTAHGRTSSTMWDEDDEDLPSWKIKARAFSLLHLDLHLHHNDETRRGLTDQSGATRKIFNTTRGRETLKMLGRVAMRAFGLKLPTDPISAPSALCITIRSQPHAPKGVDELIGYTWGRGYLVRRHEIFVSLARFQAIIGPARLRAMDEERRYWCSRGHEAVFVLLLDVETGVFALRVAKWFAIARNP